MSELFTTLGGYPAQEHSGQAPTQRQGEEERNSFLTTEDTGITEFPLLFLLRVSVVDFHFSYRTAITSSLRSVMSSIE
jgi:hypothetical protein